MKRRLPLLLLLGVGLYWIFSSRAITRSERSGPWTNVPLAKPSAGASELSAPPEDPNAVTSPIVHPIRAAASDYRLGRENAFFDDKKFLKELAPTEREAGAVIRAIEKWLADPSELARLDGGKNFMTDPPKVVLDRMTGLDLIEALAREDRGAEVAKSALASMAANDLPKNAAEPVRKAMLAEQYDALTGLARLAPDRARTLYASLSEAKKKVLSPALVAGLVDAGWKREDALKLVKP